jgi:hypothetical protein
MGDTVNGESSKKRILNLLFDNISTQNDSKHLLFDQNNIRRNDIINYFKISYHCVAIDQEMIIIFRLI